MANNNVDPLDEEEIVSRTQIKREAEALQRLGRELYDLPKKQRDTLPLDDLLIAAFQEADRITSANALRRHFQYVGKLMRKIDVEALHVAMAKCRSPLQTKPGSKDPMEPLAATLIQQGKTASESLIEQFPEFDRQLLNQLIRNACKAEARRVQGNEDSAAKNKLKKYLAQVIGETRS